MSDNSEVQRFLDDARVKNYMSDLDFLERVLQRYATLPYENITKIIRYGQASDVEAARRYPAEVISDHLRWKTGGTCFSLTNTLLEILRFLGFAPEIVMADMKVGPNVHCALKLKLLGREYLLDPGYLIDRLIQLPEDGRTEIDTPMNRICIEPDTESGTSYNVSVVRNGLKKWRYRLQGQGINESAFRQHWDRSFSLNMMRSLTLSRVSSAGQIYVSRSRLQRIDHDRRLSQNIRGCEARSINDNFQIELDLVEQALAILKAQSGERSRA